MQEIVVATEAAKMNISDTAKYFTESIDVYLCNIIFYLISRVNTQGIK